ncbi:hypothetical protein AB0C51_10585 [Streptomyces pathocidini]|uniref:hypothetical protein n=1 Tax=Streptomyces pathocidini TaxID=1650571 RepID=UPI0033EBEF3C
MTTPTASSKRTRTGTAKASAATTKASRTTAKAKKKSSGPAGRPTSVSQKSRKSAATQKAGAGAKGTEGAKTARTAKENKAKSAHNGKHTITVTVPDVKGVANEAVNAAMVPVAVAREVLPAKGGLPLYLGLGAMGVIGVLEWPVAVGIGVGYAVLRSKDGPLSPASKN